MTIGIVEIETFCFASSMWDEIRAVEIDGEDSQGAEFVGQPCVNRQSALETGSPLGIRPTPKLKCFAASFW